MGVRLDAKALSILQPRDVVVLDKLRSHKGEPARRAVRAAARTLVSAPYSPDLNLIEMLFAKG